MSICLRTTRRDIVNHRKFAQNRLPSLLDSRTWDLSRFWGHHARSRNQCRIYKLLRIMISLKELAMKFMKLEQFNDTSCWQKKTPKRFFAYPLYMYLHNDQHYKHYKNFQLTWKASLYNTYYLHKLIVNTFWTCKTTGSLLNSFYFQWSGQGL